MTTEILILLKSEWMLVFLIFLLLSLKLGKGIRNERLLGIVQLLLLVNFALGFFFNREGVLFDGMFNNTSGMQLQKNVLNLAVYLISLLFAGWLQKSEHLAEFFVLLLSALLGMFFMISSGNLLLFYLSLELATIPVAAMCNFDLVRRTSSEAAMKMILSSAFSSGILLFGISLLFGATGSISFSALPQLLQPTPLQVTAFIFIFTGFAFKLSVAPFHLWTADVYEGSPMAVTAFLSVVSKGSIAFILMTVLFRVFDPMQPVWYHLLILLSLITMVTGNLFAMRQQNIKRFLAFSSIAQVGFILVGMSSGSMASIPSVVYFILVYVFSNLAAFGVAAAVADQTGKDSINDYRGFYGSNPLLCWIMAIALFSLAGIPPTAGFFGKLFLISAGAARGNYWFITLAALNMILSLYYYLKIIRAMFMEKTEQPVPRVILSPAARLGLYLCGAGILLTGLLGWIFDYIAAAS